MAADLRRPMVFRDLGATYAAERGFSALELLVIIIIVCAVVAIGVPTLHARAKASVLEVNQQSLGGLVGEKLAEGYAPEYRPKGEGDPARFLSNHLEESLSEMGEEGYVNPFVGSVRGRVVFNDDTVPTDPEAVPPAVLITDALEYQYLFFSNLNEESRLLLAGALIVAFDSQGRTVEVFFVDAQGQRSTDVVSVPTG